MPGGDYKSLCHIYLSGVGGGRGRLCKIKYGFEGSISNLDLGLLNFSVLGEMEKKARLWFGRGISTQAETIL